MYAVDENGNTDEGFFPGWIVWCLLFGFVLHMISIEIISRQVHTEKRTQLEKYFHTRTE